MSLVVLCGRHEKTFNRSCQGGRSAGCALSNEAPRLGRRALQSGANSGRKLSRFYSGGVSPPPCVSQQKTQSSSSWAGLQTPSAKKRFSFTHSHKVNTPALESASPSGVGPSESRRAGSGRKRAASSGGWKKYASGLERVATVERTQTEAQNLKLGRLADLVFKSHAVGYESRQHPSDLATFLEFRRNSRIPPALQNDDVQTGASLLVTLFGSLFYKKSTEQIFFTVEEINFCEKLFWLAGRTSTSRSL